MKVLIIDENLMLNSKISSISKSAGYDTKIVAFFKENFEKFDEIKPDILLINLESRSNDPFKIIPGAKKRGIKVIGYCGHTRTDLANKAKEVGADFVATNGMIVSQLPQIIEGL
ncbi:hypothetical protein [Hydrogenothermus marinus]|uniref:Response regulatory domain-containing protein n=1 Tax=Hydrogenothermus marinus TaxID=133270 RepID=A0A3M0BG70_9AQUI|nr:hypothetical protein [Hydrogenothermus marinus]RMA96027.1 hypothetical protein CLV39_1038 [Hydrogenothermus marinus]